MKRHTKFISLVLAVLIALSCFSGLTIITASATDQIVYFEYPTDGTWGDASTVSVKGSKRLANVYISIWAVYGNETTFTKPTWGGPSTRCTSEGNNLYSFNLSNATYGHIDDNADYGIIFSTANGSGYQTCPITMSSECLGDTIQITGGTRENDQDSTKSDYLANWKNHSEDYGPTCGITSLGEYLDGTPYKYMPKAKMLADKLGDYLLNPINRPYFKTPAKNATLCEATGVTALEVYNQYKADRQEILDNGTVETVTVNGDSVEAVTYESTTIPALSAVAAALGVTPTPDPEPTEAPTTVAPTTVAPTTVKPTTVPVVTTAKPTTKPVVTTAKPTTKPVATTAKPTTVPVTTVPATTVAPTTVAPADTLTVSAVSNYFPSVDKVYANPVGEEVNVSYALKAPGKSLVNAQFEYLFDPAVLSYSSKNSTSTVSPLAASKTGSAVYINDTNASQGRVIINLMNTSGISLSGTDAFADVVFDVLAANNATTSVNLKLTWLTICDEGNALDIDSWLTADESVGDFKEKADLTKEGADVSVDVTSTAAEVGSKLMGDANQDGAVTIADVTLIQKFIAKLEFYNELQFTVSDVDYDHRVTIMDVTRIQKYLAHIIPSLDPEEPVSQSSYTVISSPNFLATGWNFYYGVNELTANSDGTYSTTIEGFVPDSLDAIYSFKIAEWPDGDDQSAIVIHGLDGTGTVEVDKTLNVDFSLSGTSDITITFNPATGEIGVSGPGVVAAKIDFNYITILGNGEDNWMNGLSWDEAFTAGDNDMMENEDGIYEIEFEDIYDFDNYQFKFAANGNWSINWGAGELVNTEGSLEGGEVTFTYDLRYNGSNVFLEVPYEGNVKIVLDLTNFDKTTKQGAVCRVTVTEI